MRVARAFFGYVLIGLMTTLCFCTTAMAQTETLDVGTIERPPFATKVDDEWSGYSVEIIEEIAGNNGLDIVWQEQTVFADMLKRTEQSDLDLAAANISVTSNREDSLDFSTPIYESGLQIFIPASAQSSSFFSVIWNSGVIQFVGLAALILIVMAHLVWYFERHHKGQDYFRDTYKGGIWDAFWWAFIIVTIGGFENERPERPIGRVLAIIWIIASIFFISAFTAKITTSLTVAQLQSDISDVDDLRGKKVGAPRGTTISSYLQTLGVEFIEYEDFTQVVEAVEDEELDAGVGDAPVIQFYTQGEGRGKIVLAGEVFAEDSIAVAFPEDSPYFETINKGILKLRENGKLAEIREKYFGD